MPSPRLVHAVLLLALGAAAYWVASPAREVGAGTAPALDLEQVLELTSDCFQGRVTSRTASVAPDGVIETAYRIAVDERFVGTGGSDELVVLPGGVLPDGRGLAIAGVPVLEVGDETLLFLSARHAASGRRMAVGLEQGRYRLISGKDGRRIAIGAGGAFVARTAEAHDGATLHALPYDELRARLVAALQRRAAEAR